MATSTAKALYDATYGVPGAATPAVKSQLHAWEVPATGQGTVKGQDNPFQPEWTKSRTSPAYWADFYQSVGAKPDAMYVPDSPQWPATLDSALAFLPTGKSLTATIPQGPSFSATTPDAYNAFAPDDPLLAENGLKVGGSGKLEPVGGNSAVKAAMSQSSGGQPVSAPAAPSSPAKPYMATNGYWYLPSPNGGAPMRMGRDLFKFGQANPDIKFSLPGSPFGPGSEFGYRLQQAMALAHGQPGRAAWGGGLTASETYDLANRVGVEKAIAGASNPAQAARNAPGSVRDTYEQGFGQSARPSDDPGWIAAQADDQVRQNLHLGPGMPGYDQALQAAIAGFNR